MIPPLSTELNKEDHFDNKYKILVILNYWLIFFIVLKLQYYFRISPKFGLLVHLIQRCIIEVAPFMIFMFLWIVAFSAMYYVLGSYSSVAMGYEGVPLVLGYVF